MAQTVQKLQRQTRIRKKLRANKGTVRLTVFRSNKYVYAQLIDDLAGETLAAVSEKQLTEMKGLSRMDLAKQVGIALAKKAGEKKITTVVFDKGSYAYHGRVKAIAEGAREGGLLF